MNTHQYSWQTAVMEITALGRSSLCYERLQTMPGYFKRGALICGRDCKHPS